MTRGRTTGSSGTTAHFSGRVSKVGCSLSLGALGQCFSLYNDDIWPCGKLCPDLYGLQGVGAQQESGNELLQKCRPPCLKICCHTTSETHGHDCCTTIPSQCMIWSCDFRKRLKTCNLVRRTLWRRCKGKRFFVR